MKREIYLDSAAATPMLTSVKEAMMPFLSEQFGNPSSVHGMGQRARQALDGARNTVAGALNCNPREIIFTGSGTESDNMAIQGIARAYGDSLRAADAKNGATIKPHIITSTIEHSAVLNTCKYLEDNYDFDVTYLEPTIDGIITPESVRDAIKETTILCSIMYGNNEIGSINDIAAISAVCHGDNPHKKQVIFHSDACQVGGFETLDVSVLGVDLMTLNGSKIYGPKGVGILYKKAGTQLVPLIFGGEGQEHRLRAGTENVSAISGFAVAIKEAEAFRKNGVDEMRELKAYLIEALLEIPDTSLNGPRKGGLPHIVNVSFEGIDGAALLLRLDMEGIYATSGSACTSGSLDPSHVLLGIGKDKEEATSAIRLSLLRTTTKEDLTFVIEKIKEIVADLRESSPLY